MKIVKITQDRGFLEGCYEVLSELRDMYQLQHIATGKKVTIFKVHCFHDKETISTTCSLRKERASKIGRH